LSLRVFGVDWISRTVAAAALAGVIQLKKTPTAAVKKNLASLLCISFSFSFSSAYHRDVGWSHFSINFFCLVAGDVNDDGRDDIYDRPGHGPVVLFSLSVPSSISDLVLLSRLSASSRVGDRKRDQSQKGHHQSLTKGPPLPPPHTHPHTEKSFIDY